MSIGRVLGRALLASIFIRNGADHLRHPAPIVRAARGAEVPAPELAVALHSGVMAGAGTLLALGVAPHLSATVLAASLVPTTVIGHPFWTKDGHDRERQTGHFLKNLALFGALLYVSAQDG